MRLRRLPAVAALCAAAVLATAASAVADPPWSPPTAVPGVGNGPAVATA